NTKQFADNIVLLEHLRSAATMPKGIFYGDQRLANLVNFEVSLRRRKPTVSISPTTIMMMLLLEFPVQMLGP
ncbi:hypothetical protein, partial [Synechococcus sp. CCY9202]|uniref:hypothetical protein n=1 Tax=Synechococcus sp. CCY9202 TaxID=174698 RepID=UPI002B211FE9